MKRILAACLLVLSALVSRSFGADGSLQSLLDTERSFARMSVDAGMDTSFLAHLADDGIILRPGPVNGKLWFRTNPSNKTLLKWEPTYGDVSAVGDLGFTTGPWTATSLRDSTQDARCGHYLSMWRREKGKGWKLAFDCGIGHSAPAAGRLVSLMDDAAWARERVFHMTQHDAASQTEDLLSADQKLARMSEKGEAEQSLLGAMDLHALAYRDGMLPIIGRDSIAAVLASRPGNTTYLPLAAEVARSGDIGYTYGSVTHKRVQGYYLRIWRRQIGKPWFVIVDLESLNR
jgi:ketosteroid isomerase-like protein